MIVQYKDIWIGQSIILFSVTDTKAMFTFFLLLLLSLSVILYMYVETEGFLNNMYILVPKYLHKMVCRCYETFEPDVHSLSYHFMATIRHVVYNIYYA